MWTLSLKRLLLEVLYASMKRLLVRLMSGVAGVANCIKNNYFFVNILVKCNHIVHGVLQAKREQISLLLHGFFVNVLGCFVAKVSLRICLNMTGISQPMENTCV
jgi:hypothetical protein